MAMPVVFLRPSVSLQHLSNDRHVLLFVSDHASVKKHATSSTWRPRRQAHPRVLTSRKGASSIIHAGSKVLPASEEVSELYKVLDLASKEELRELSEILYGRSLMSPLVKSLAGGDGGGGQPIEESLWKGDRMGAGERHSLLTRLERRFLFLAGDAKATIRGQPPSYRGVLLAVRSRLGVRCSSQLPTADLEGEIFLHLMESYEREGEEESAGEAPGVSAPFINSGRVGGGGRLKGAVRAALRMAGDEIMATAVKGGSALTVAAVKNMLLQRLGGKVIVERAKYEVAKEVLKKGLAGSAARFVTLRSTALVVGPILWGTFLADLVVQSLGPDYGRVLRAIYTVAQVFEGRYNCDGRVCYIIWQSGGTAQ